MLSLPSDETRRWFYLWAHPKFANRLVNELSAEGATAVYVMERQRRLRKDGRGIERPEIVTRPLFSGCVFCHGTIDHRYVAQDSIARARTFDIRNQVRFRDQLVGVMQIAGWQVDLQRKPLAVGQRVRIVGGPYANFIGQTYEVVQEKNGRVWFNAPLMGTSVLMDLSRDEVEVV